ncbi:hypothetical protein ACFOSH_36740, partial [Amycolatopsis speibonae]
MSPNARAVDPDRLVRWCREYLGSPPAEELFRSGFLSVVIGLRLVDGREVVIKVRPDSPRLAACVEVQRRLFQAGYPCPRPLTGAAPLGGDVRLPLWTGHPDPRQWSGEGCLCVTFVEVSGAVPQG